MQGTPSDEPNPTRAAADWPAAVIAGAYQTGVLAMRDLSRRRVRVTCFDNDGRFEGFHSPYGTAHLCPNPDSDPRGWIAFMIALSDRMGGKPVLICSSDLFVAAVALHADELAPHFVLSPGVHLHGLLATKETQYELAAKHGMPLPRTRVVHSAAEVQAFADEALFPCLVKPVHFREWQTFPSGHPLSHEKVAISDSPAALLRNWQLASAAGRSAILQEIIQGPDTAKRVYLSCYDRQSRRIAHAMFRELRCSPLQFGPATVTEPVIDEEVDGVCDRFLRKIGYSGICEIEMKRDARDGRVKLIEANPRLSGGGDAAPYAGVDLCWMHYLDLIGEAVTPVAPSGKDFRHVALRYDVGAIIAYRRAHLISWGEIVRSYKPPLAFFDFDLHDWRYSARTIYLMVRSALGSLVRMMFPRRPQG